MHVKKGDTVKIIAGKERVLGPAEVLKVIPSQNRVIVEGRNLVKKHLKGNQLTGTESRIEEVEAPIHASNVMLWSKKIEAPVRTQSRFVGEGGDLFTTKGEALKSFKVTPNRIRKVRYAKKSDEIFE